MKARNTEKLSGLKIIEFPHFSDDRGWFTKTFHSQHLQELFGDEFVIRECFHSMSKKNVVRGMHFQVPPANHHKLIYVSSGHVTDVILDLRKNSPTYGEYEDFELNADRPTGLLIPSGFAHGFVSRSDSAIINYYVTHEHNPECDRGVSWDSFGYNWQVENPKLSDRDLSHLALAQFESPF
ncbi:MAG: dTDP-4-dehydrorhamnose 3,5-epimerase family protein [Bdellovibrionales bacterium]